MVSAIINHKRRLWMWWVYGVVVVVPLFIIGIVIGLDELNNCGRPISIRHWIPVYAIELLSFWIIVFPMIMRFSGKFKKIAIILVIIHFVFMLGWTIFGTISFARDSQRCHGKNQSQPPSQITHTGEPINYTPLNGSANEKFWILALSYLVIGYLHILGLLYLIITGLMWCVLHPCLTESYRVVKS